MAGASAVESVQQNQCSNFTIGSEREEEVLYLKEIIGGLARHSTPIAAALLVASSLGAGSALAEDAKVTLKIPTAFNTDLPTTGDSAVYFADTVEAVTGGTVTAKLFNPGELMPAFEIHKAVSDGQVEAGYTASAYLGGSLKEAIPFTTFPFSPEPIVFLSWLYEGNGLNLYQKMYDDAGYNLKVFPLGVWASEGAGWFTKRVENPEDWEGVKIRIGGLAAPTVAKMGAVPTLIPFSEIFSGLEKGVIDAAEMGLPANDLRAGLYKVANFYHFPSWQQPATTAELIINKDVWNGMSDTQRAQVEAAVRQTNMHSLMHANATQNAALQELQDRGVEIVRFSDEMLAQMRSAFKEVVSETAAEHPNFKVVWDDLSAFMEDYQAWENVGMIGRNQDAFD